ncbi:MAG: lysophospholipid acyltransferase family protein [Gemmatimonadota bacterium]|nr:lysophospholipid acyltransferase family protein [Gemmatimonadota bacterium]
MRHVANGILRLIGWRMVGEVPKPQCVLIGAPHTSNWDFVFALLAFWSLDFECRWVGKHTIFKPPFGWLMRRLGGIPLDRSTTRDFVPEVVSWFEDEPELTLCIAPEGTRSRKDYWRSGFYWIAYGAGVPIGLGFLDYENKVGGIGETIVPTGDIEADMEKIRSFYAEMRGRHPEKLSPIQLRPGTAGGEPG